MNSKSAKCTVELEQKPDFEKAMQGIYALYEQEMID